MYMQSTDTENQWKQLHLGIYKKKKSTEVELKIVDYNIKFIVALRM